jgi:hypothetical protein
MNPIELQGYMVKLGFQADAVSFSKFQSTFGEAQRIAEAHAGGITKSMLAMQGTITGTFAAAGLAVLGLADKVAQADLGFQLFGMKMYLAANQAKSLKIATDALGHSLGEIAWNPELRERFDQLVEDQNRLQAGLGPDFEEQMKRIRDIRFQFTRLEVEAQYLGMSVVTNLMRAFGTGPDQILGRLQKMNDWIIQNLPALSQKIAVYFLPIWKDIKLVLGDTVDLAKEMGIAFSNIVGLLSGNSTLEGTAFSFDKIAGSIQTATHGLAEFAGAVIDAEKLLAHLASAAALLASGHFGAAKAEAAAALADLRTGTGAVLGAEAGSLTGATVGALLGIEGGPLGMLAGASVGGMLATGAGALVGAGIGRGAESLRQGDAGTFADAIQNYIAQTAQTAGVDPRLALAVAKVESNFRQFDANGNVLRPNDPNSHAAGIFQLQPSTARQMGVDSSNPWQNVQGGVGYLQALLKQYGGNENLALQHYYGSKDSAANAAYADRVMRIESGITINSLTISTPSGKPDDIRRSVADGLTDAQRRQAGRNLAEFQSLGWSY